MSNDWTEDVGVVPPPPPRERARALVTGTLFADRYEIRSVSGTGGFSLVYAAFDREARREVALKVLRADRSSEDTVARFRREVTIARDIESPHLVRIFDIGEIDDSIYMTMELLSGGSLAQRLEQGPLMRSEVLATSTAVLEALGALHRVGIVHRDVKPGNILVGADGAQKLGDFGLARHWKDDDTLTKRRTAGLVGTYAYISPEQALGQELDARSDLYSFGILLFEMLAGSVPWPVQSAIAAIVAHIHSDVPDVRALAPETPAGVAALVASLLQKERTLRPPSPDAVLEILWRHC